MVFGVSSVGRPVLLESRGIPCTSLLKFSVSLFGLFTKAGGVFSNLGAIPPSVSSDPTFQGLFATCLDHFQDVK